MMYILSVHADVTLHRRGPRVRGLRKGGRRRRRPVVMQTGPLDGVNEVSPHQPQHVSASLDEEDDDDDDEESEDDSENDEDGEFDIRDSTKNSQNGDLMLLQAYLMLSAAARSNNKSQNTLLVLQTADYAWDAIYFGKLLFLSYLTRSTHTITKKYQRDLTTRYQLAASEINQSPNVMPDATIQLHKATIDFLTVCPNILAYSSDAADDRLSDKQKYPYFWRYVSTWTQLVRSSLSFYVYYGWTKIAIVYTASGVFPTVAKTYYTWFVPAGIDVGAIAEMSDYVPPGYYYDQIGGTFRFLRSTKLRIFVAVSGYDVLGDVMMAANITGLVGYDYVVNSTFKSNFTNHFNTVVPQVLSNITWLSQYPSININETDQWASDYPLNFFYDDYGTWTLPAFYIQAGYSLLWQVTLFWDKASLNTFIP
eukprot:jgi/Hompol1/1588/HPOL_002767-RA